jgi:thiamine-monophosphate kinase
MGESGPKTLRDLGENALLRTLFPRLPRRPDVLVGPGDDCAVVRIPRSPLDWLFTTDAVIEGRHFLPDAPPRRVGRKAIARAVSDVAAMGGTPAWILVDLVAPPETPVARIQSLYQGITAAARKWNLAILGGDTSQGPLLELHVACVGHVPRGTALLRSGARPRDILYVTGSLGGAYLPGNNRHLLFEPRLAAGQFLAANRFATAMMDLSDGIATDLPRLLDASRRGARLDLSAIPLSPAARRTSDPLRHALCDGEDFELLFTVSHAKRSRFESAWKRAFPKLPATPVGRILPAPSHRPDFGSGGFEHFRSAP